MKEIEFLDRDASYEDYELAVEKLSDEMIVIECFRAFIRNDALKSHILYQEIIKRDDGDDTFYIEAFNTFVYDQRTRKVI